MDRDTPTDLDDTSWLAIEGGTVEAICQTLAPSGPEAGDLGSWHGCCRRMSRRLSAGHRQRDGRRVPHAVDPRLRTGCRALRRGGTTGSRGRRPTQQLATRGRLVPALDQKFAQAHAFTDQAQLDWYSWIIARDGVILRQVVYDDGEFLSDRGRPTGVEARWIARFRPDEIRSRWYPDVGDVPRIAGEWSVNPWKIGPRTRTVGPGFVAATPHGRHLGLRLNNPSPTDASP